MDFSQYLNDKSLLRADCRRLLALQVRRRRPMQTCASANSQSAHQRKRLYLLVAHKKVGCSSKNVTNRLLSRVCECKARERSQQHLSPADLVPFPWDHCLFRKADTQKRKKGSRAARVGSGGGCIRLYFASFFAPPRPYIVRGQRTKEMFVCWHQPVKQIRLSE